MRACLPPTIRARLAYMGHVEYLIRNRRLNGIQAVAAVNTSYPFCVWPLYHDSAVSHGSSQSFRDLFQPVTDAEERFMAEVYPQVLQFPAGRASENPEFTAIFHERGPLASDDLHSLWLEGLVSWFIKERASRQYPTPHDLDFLLRLLTEYVPDRCRTPNGMVQFLENRGIMRNLRQRTDSEANADDAWVAFLRRLAQANNRMASLYGRFGLLNRDFEKHLANVHSRKPPKSLLAGVEAWLKDYAAIDSEAANRNWKLRENLYNSVDQMRKQLVYELKQPAQVAVRLEYCGAIYVPGLSRNIGYMHVGGGRYVSRFNRDDARWFRIDPETFRVEVLELGPTYPNLDCWYGVSNHYGLIGGCRAIGNSPARLFRVSVEEPDKGGAAAVEADVGPDELRPVQPGLLLVATSRVGFTAAGQVETRIWTTADGGSRVWARLVKANKDAVVLEKEDGVRVTVLRETLSHTDLDYLAELVAPKH